MDLCMHRKRPHVAALRLFFFLSIFSPMSAKKNTSDIVDSPLPNGVSQDNESQDLDKIRNILFGSQAQALKSDLSQLHKDFESRLKKLQAHFDDQLEKMQASFDEQLTSLEKRINKDADTFSSDVSDLKGDLSDMRSHAADQHTSLLKTVQETREALEAELNTQVEQVQKTVHQEFTVIKEDKTGRPELANLLSELAEKLRG